jgi:hypothetical protein
MSTENALAEVKTAPEAEVTATPVEAPVSGEKTPDDKAQPVEKKFSQEEVDEIVSKRLAREERKRERERVAADAARVVAPVKTEAPVKPQPEAFKTTEDYIEAVAEWKAEQTVSAKLEAREKAAKEAASRQVAESVSTEFQERAAKVVAQLPDFEEVAFNPRLPITEHMANTIHELERGPELIYHLGKNPAEALRIAKLSPYLQAIELGRLEAKLPEVKPVKKPSSAPEPIVPVTGGKSGTPVFDTTDPRSTKSMTSSEWIEAENNRIREQLRARGYR